MTAIETDQFVGLRSDASIEEPATVHSTIRYGNYPWTVLPRGKRWQQDLVCKAWQMAGPSRLVDIYDVDSNSWTRGPELLGEPMDGFGSSSFATGGRLYATTYHGLLQRLAEDGSGWELVAELPTQRFFHRMLPIDDSKLVTLGGASMSSGKFGAIEVISVH